MKVAYVDTSCLVAVAFGERNAAAVAKRLANYDLLLSSNLLEAELRSACRREATDVAQDLLDTIAWAMPDRPLGAEIATVFEAGYVRGADAWHLATALFLAPDPSALHFETLDDQQGRVARSLGFKR